ncbi:MAG: PepSY-associated TM helix domain-containing protein [Flammeovirgaceae bacterium]|nr:MAG: PepSY-associated TM helix domain-containing protein [Flammeovirgaceae bacterium]
MSKKLSGKIRRLNIITHRDAGYFFSSLIIIYSLSGIALNHVDEWNPDFIIEKKEVRVPPGYATHQLSADLIVAFSKLAGEEQFKVYDIPAKNRVKIYYDNASLFIDLETGEGLYEKIKRRPVFYQSNVLHRNSLKGWKWVSDIFGGFLIIISITGLFVLKGKNGVTGRGKWFMAAGFLLPVIALILHELS